MPRKRTKTHPGTITRYAGLRADSWRVRLCVGAQVHSFTVRGTKTDAANFATTKHAELSGDLGRSRSGLPGPVRFSALVEEFAEYELPQRAEGTRKSYRNSFVAFAAYFGERLGDPMVRDIRRSHVATFLEWRRTFRAGGEGLVSPHTVARDRRVLHRLFNYAILKDHLDANPCTMVRAPKGDPRTPPILSDAQLDALLGAASHHPMLSLYILLLAETGLRSLSEALHLRWEDVDLAGGFLHVRSAPGRRTKSGRSRSVPMTARLRSALQIHAARFRLAVYDGQRSPFLFHHISTARSLTAGARIASMREAFERAIARADLPAGFRPHDLRHRRVTTWLAGGASPVLVKEAVGHASLSTTMGYTHLLPEHLRVLVQEQAGASEVAKHA